MKNLTEWMELKEHIRLRAGMYIGRLGNGRNESDGIYVLLSTILNNSIDEFNKGNVTQIDVEIADDKTVIIRDDGRGIDFDKLCNVVTSSNRVEPPADERYHKSFGLHGHGLAIVNALSSRLEVQSHQKGLVKCLCFEKGNLKDERGVNVAEGRGVAVTFTPDTEIFGEFCYYEAFVLELLRLASYLNTGLRIRYNGALLCSEDGLAELLEDKKHPEHVFHYPIIHLKDENIEIAFTHSCVSNNYSFANGFNTRDGGTHLTAFKQALADVLLELFEGNDFKADDVYRGLVGAIHVRLLYPRLVEGFRWKLGVYRVDDNCTMYDYLYRFLDEKLKNYLTCNDDVRSLLFKELCRAREQR